MNMPARAVEIIHALYTANPQNDEERRIHIQRTGEQLCHELGPNWGNKKRAGLSDDFRSPDSIAYRESDGTISIWDIQLSSGAIDVYDGKPPNYPNDSPGNSTFMPCQPVNHLGTPQNPDVPGEIPPNSGTVDLTPVLTELAHARVEIAEVKATMDMVLALLNAQLGQPVTFPAYRGSIGLPGWVGGNRPIELKPEGQ